MRSLLLRILLVAGLSSSVYSQQPKAITNSIGMKLVLILPGSFTMGSPITEVGRQDWESQHLVTISALRATHQPAEKAAGKVPAGSQFGNQP